MRVSPSVAILLGLLAGAFTLARTGAWGALADGFPNPSGDMAQALSGALAYVRDDWRFPLFDVGGMSALGVQSILFTDSIPGYAFILKALRADPAFVSLYFVPIFFALSFLLQGAAAAFVAHMLGVRQALALLAIALLFTAWPALLARFSLQHLALTSHWVVLLSVGLMLAPGPGRRRHLVWWCSLAVLGLLLHPYFFVIAAACFAVRALLDTVGRAPGDPLRMGWRGKAFEGAVFLLVSVVAMIVFGHLGSGAAPAGGYSGYYSMNLAAPLMPEQTSLFFESWTSFPRGQSAGYAYFGVAGVGILAAGLAACLCIRSTDGTAFRRTAILTVFFLLTTLYALSDEVYFGERFLVELPFPGIVKKIGANFRDHSRFFWIVGYGLLFLSIMALWRCWPRAGTGVFIAAALLMQIEMTPMFARTLPFQSAYASDPQITALVSDAETVSMHPPFPCHGSTGAQHHDIQLVAARAEVPLKNAFVSGRSGLSLCPESELSGLHDGLKQGELAVVPLDKEWLEDQLYAFSGSAVRCRRHLDLAFCASDAGSFPELAKLARIEPNRFPVPVRLTFEAGANGERLSRSGFSPFEPWGVWSVGKASQLTVPFAENSRQPSKVTLRIDGFAPLERKTGYETTVILTGLGQAFSDILGKKTHRFEPGESGQTTIAFDIEPAGRAFEGLRIDISVTQPLSPAEIDLSTDSRVLGISLFELAIE